MGSRKYTHYSHPRIGNVIAFAAVLAGFSVTLDATAKLCLMRREQRIVRKTVTNRELQIKAQMAYRESDATRVREVQQAPTTQWGPSGQITYVVVWEASSSAPASEASVEEPPRGWSFAPPDQMDSDPIEPSQNTTRIGYTMEQIRVEQGANHHE